MEYCQHWSGKDYVQRVTARQKRQFRQPSLLLPTQLRSPQRKPRPRVERPAGQHVRSIRAQLFLTEVVLPLTLCFIAMLLIFVDFSLWQSTHTLHIKLPSSARKSLDMLTFAQSGIAGMPKNTVRDAEASLSEPINLDITDTFQWRDYTVKKGDSVSKIAADAGLSLDAVIASNGMSNARFLAAGTKIKLPNMDGIPYTVQKGDTYAGIAAKFAVPLEVILDANDVQNDTVTAGTHLFIPGARMKGEDLRAALGDRFIYPIRAKVSSRFGWRISPITLSRHFHGALDLAAARGTPVKASCEGTVAAVGYNTVYGRFVIISHPQGFESLYAHLDSQSVKKGQRVAQGTVIGKVGSTGQSTGPHLHFALFKNGKAVNPLSYVK